jgi:nitrite reductase/ring-hydroxylating ferredoxin subunit
VFTPTRVSEIALKAKGHKVVRRDGKQILLVARAEGVFAIANRCPHEGYPLSDGTPGPGCVLTCNWHNWKFDLRTGEALVGRDPVRTYPVAIREGEIFLDLADPPGEALRARALAGLETALRDNDLARMAREMARLERAGFEAREALVHAIIVLNDRLEDGTTHAHGAAANWLALADRAPTPEARLIATLEPVAHLAFDTQGADRFSYAEDERPWNAREFLVAAEGEREADAISLTRGALRDGEKFASLQPVFGEAALAHYADFGHSAIYVVNVGELITRLDARATEPLMLALTRALVRARREERLPEFRGYDKALAEWDGEGRASISADSLAGLSVNDALAQVVRSSARPVREIYDALVSAAAANMLHFDLAYDNLTHNPIADNVGWLDFTHALTFAHACRAICETRPDLWPRALLQLALFVGRNAAYVDRGLDAEEWHVNDREGYLRREIDALYDHGIPEPIIACHRLKVLFALERELADAPDAPWADAMCAAVNRYLNTPMKRHHGLRTAAQALDFIDKEG